MAAASTNALARKAGPLHLLAKHKARALQCWLLALLVQAVHLFNQRRRIPRSLSAQERPFLAFTGSGLKMAYYHGVATYIRDHFYVDNLQLSAISGGTSTILALAMGIDLYQIMLLGLHMKKWLLRQGLYLNSFETMSNEIKKRFREIGITDKDVELMSARQQVFIGVTPCTPPFKHYSAPVPTTISDLSDLFGCSSCVMPFFSTPGTYKGKYYIDGGFSAVWSVPSDKSWHDITKVTCVPAWATRMPPVYATADIHPNVLYPTETVVMYPWAHQQKLIKRGYEDTRKFHDRLLARGLRPLPNAPLTPWSRWEKLFADIDESHLPELSTQRSTANVSEFERAHDEVLRTHSASDLAGLLDSQRRFRQAGGGAASQSDAFLSERSPKRSLQLSSNRRS